MKLTPENLKIYEGQKMVFFANGVIDGVYKVDCEDQIYAIADYESFYKPSEFSDMFVLSDIKMPEATTEAIRTTLAQILPKDRTAMQMFHDMEEGILKRMCLGFMDGTLAQESTVVSLSDAIELCIDKSANKKYWEEVLTSLKASGK